MVIRPSTYTTVWELWTRTAGPKVRNLGPKVLHQTKGAFHFPKPGVALPASAKSQFTTSFHTFLRSLSDGVFKSLKTGGDYNGRLVRTQPTHRGFDSVIRTARARSTRTSFGPTLRPTAYPSHVSHVGLGAARNFSSARPLFQNIVENVPLALRALVDQGGIDERKWRAERRAIRMTEKKAMKGKGRQMQVMDRNQWQHEFANYFDSPVVASATASEDAILSHPIVLILPLEPSLSLGASSLSPLSDPLSSSYRILSPSTLQSFLDIESSYATHARLIHALSNRLSSAGVFDDPDVIVEMRFFDYGYKEVQVAFGGRWTKRDVEQAAGVWDGRGSWIEIRDLRETTSDVLRFDVGECDSEVDYGSVASHEHEEHDAVARSLVLPSFDTPSYSDASFSPVRSISPDPSHWEDEDLTFSSSSFVVDEEDDLSDQSGWDRETGSGRASYESGVRDFLDELDEVEEMRGRAPAMFARM